MQAKSGTARHAALTAALELGVVLIWTLWLGRAYLNMDPRQWPLGREFGMAIQPHFVWTHLLECGPCVLWNGGWNGGSPTFVELHAAVAHPLVVVATVLLGGVNGAKVALLASLFMAGAGQWWLARAMGLGSLARVWGACLVVGAGHLVGRMEIGAVGLVISMAACSLVLAPALQVARRGTRRDVVLFAVTLALAIVAGQGYLQIGLLLAILPLYALFLFDGSPDRRARMRAALAGLGLAVLLAAVFLVPLIRFWPRFGKDADPTFHSAQPLSYVPLNLVISEVDFYQNTSLGKLPYGYLYLNYVGWIPVVLALAAPALIPKNKWRLLLFCGLGVAVSLLMAAGIPFRWIVPLWPAVVGAIRYVPLLGGLAAPFVIALAAWSLDELLKRRWPLIAFESATGAHRLLINTMAVTIPLLVVASLVSIYRFSQDWLIVLPQDSANYQVVDAARTESTQWVALPFGDHYWSVIAGEAGVKLTNVVRPSQWRGRRFPAPYVQAERQQMPEGELLATINDIWVAVQAAHSYATVDTGVGSIPCQARGQNGSIEVVCDSPMGGTLEVQENAWSGWQVWRDGQRVALLDGSQWLRAEAIPGRHVYRFEYRPWDVWLGLALSVLGLLLAAVLWWPGLLAWARRRPFPISCLLSASPRLRVSPHLPPPLFRV
jgi:hypothetical protein